jgi:hypothetical protein
MIFIPRELVDEAKSFARDTVDRAMQGMFGLIDAAVKRRQSYGFAQEKSLFHQRMFQRLPIMVPNLKLLGPRMRRHLRLHVKWEAKAFARDPKLSAACGLKCPITGPRTV